MGLLDGEGRHRHRRAARGIGRGHALGGWPPRGASVLVNDLGCSTRGDGGDVLDAEKTVSIIEGRGGVAAADGSDIASFDGAAAVSTGPSSCSGGSTSS